MLRGTILISADPLHSQIHRALLWGPTSIFKQAKITKKACLLPRARIWKCHGPWYPVPRCIAGGPPFLLLVCFPRLLESSLLFGVLLSPRMKSSFSGFTGALDQWWTWTTSSEELVVSQWSNEQRSKVLGVPALFATGLLLSPLGRCSSTSAVLWTGAIMACRAGTGRLWWKLHWWKRPLFYLPYPSLELWQQIPLVN